MRKRGLIPSYRRWSLGRSATRGVALVLALGCASLGTVDDGRAEVERGAHIYAAECAACHGGSLQGQPRWWQGNAAGRLPAPPLDGSGHAWQHADAELVEFVTNSMANVAGPDYATDMPAFAGRLDGAEIRAVIAFIKSHWSAGVRAARAASSPGNEAALIALLREGGDWTFPPDCLDPAQRAALSAARSRSGR